MLLLLLSLALSDPAATYSRGRIFHVHFEIAAEDCVSPAKVILLARQPGEEWSPAGDAAPGESIRFVPSGDGVYHLSAVAVGIDGTREEVGTAPEAILVVDTAPPKLLVSRSSDGDGPSVRILWEAVDENLSPEGVGVRLELGEVEATWQGRAKGKIYLNLPRNGEEWRVRLVAVDLAGNRSETLISCPEELEMKPKVDLAGLGERLTGAYARGRSLLSRGLWVSAERELRKAVALTPRDCRAWNDLGVALHRQGRRSEAREAFARALADSPDDPISRWNFALGGVSDRSYRGQPRAISRLSHRRLGAWEGEPLEVELAALAQEIHRAKEE